MKKFNIILFICCVLLVVVIPTILAVKFQNQKNSFAVVSCAEISVGDTKDLQSTLDYIKSSGVKKVVLLGNIVKSATAENYQELKNLLNNYSNITFYYQKGIIESLQNEDLFTQYFTDISEQTIDLGNYLFYFRSNPEVNVPENVVNSEKQVFIFSNYPADNHYASSFDNNLSRAVLGKNNISVVYNFQNLSPLAANAFYKPSYAGIAVGGLNVFNTKYPAQKNEILKYASFNVSPNQVAYKIVDITNKKEILTNKYDNNDIKLSDKSPTFKNKNYKKITEGSVTKVEIDAPNNIEYVEGYKIDLYNKTSLIKTISLGSDYLVGLNITKQSFEISKYDYGDVASLKIYIISTSGNISEEYIDVAYIINDVEL